MFLVIKTNYFSYKLNKMMIFANGVRFILKCKCSERLTSVLVFGTCLLSLKHLYGLADKENLIRHSGRDIRRKHFAAQGKPLITAGTVDLVSDTLDGNRLRPQILIHSNIEIISLLFDTLNNSSQSEFAPEFGFAKIISQRLKNFRQIVAQVYSVRHNIITDVTLPVSEGKMCGCRKFDFLRCCYRIRSDCTICSSFKEKLQY